MFPGVWQGTAVEGTIQQLFEGHHMNYIECINVDYKSTRKESFYGMGLQLIKGGVGDLISGTILFSLEIETLVLDWLEDGDNYLSETVASQTLPD